MKLSTKGVYGLRALINLASAESPPVLLKDIAQQEQISEKYLESIFASLRKVNIIDAVRGKNGGYSLALPANKISLNKIINALEGSNKFALQKNIPKNSSILNVMKEVDDKIKKHLESITLDDLLSDNTSCNYSI